MSNVPDAPDNNDNGYQFWLAKLNAFNGDSVQAEMVKAFITSFEYRARFGTPNESGTGRPPVYLTAMHAD